MTEAKAPKKAGRPPRFPEEGARVSLSIRLKRSTDKALREAASRNNRSMAEEIEFRVNQSFEGILISLSSDVLRELQEHAEKKSISIHSEAVQRIATFNNNVLDAYLMQMNFDDRMRDIELNSKRTERSLRLQITEADLERNHIDVAQFTRYISINEERFESLRSNTSNNEDKEEARIIKTAIEEDKLLIEQLKAKSSLLSDQIAEIKFDIDRIDQELHKRKRK